MMSQHQVAVILPSTDGIYSVPLLDDEFDPAEEEIFEHGELSAFHLETDENEEPALLDSGYFPL